MSDPIKEPRCDSKLKNLPEERQSEIIARLASDGFVKTCAWLREDGIDTSTAALSAFRSWYRIKEQYRRKESIVLQVLELKKKEQPTITPEELFEHGQMIFSAISLEEEDAEQWVNVQQLTASTNLEKEKLKLKSQAENRMQAKLKFEINKWINFSSEKILQAAQDKRAQKIAELNIPNAEKIARIRQTYFADVDMLEKSGQVKLPQ